MGETARGWRERIKAVHGGAGGRSIAAWVERACGGIARRVHGGVALRERALTEEVFVQGGRRTHFP